MNGGKSDTKGRPFQPAHHSLPYKILIKTHYIVQKQQRKQYTLKSMQSKNDDLRYLSTCVSRVTLGNFVWFYCVCICIFINLDRFTKHATIVLAPTIVLHLRYIVLKN